MAATLTAFLAGNARRPANRKIAVSARFTDADGRPLEWEVTCISAAENQKLRQASLRQTPVPGRRGQFRQELDAAKYQAGLAARCTVFPDLNDAALQESWGVMGAEALVGAMLTPGEFDTLVAEILDLCGFADAEELTEAAKN